MIRLLLGATIFFGALLAFVSRSLADDPINGFCADAESAACSGCKPYPVPPPQNFVWYDIGVNTYLKCRALTAGEAGEYGGPWKCTPMMQDCYSVKDKKYDVYLTAKGCAAKDPLEKVGTLTLTTSFSTKGVDINNSDLCPGLGRIDRPDEWLAVNDRISTDLLSFNFTQSPCAIMQLI